MTEVVHPYLVKVTSKQHYYKSDSSYYTIVEAVSPDQARYLALSALGDCKVEYQSERRHLERGTLYNGFDTAVRELPRDAIEYLGHIGLHKVASTLLDGCIRCRPCDNFIEIKGSYRSNISDRAVAKNFK